MRGEVVAGAEPTEHQVGMRARERRAQRSVADHDETQYAAARLLHRAVRRDGELDVLLRGEPPHVEGDQIARGRAPFGAERRGAASGIEPAVIDAAAEHAETLEAGGLELVAKTLGRHEGTGGRVVEAPQVGRDRAPQPAHADSAPCTGRNSCGSRCRRECPARRPLAPPTSRAAPRWRRTPHPDDAGSMRRGARHRRGSRAEAPCSRVAAYRHEQGARRRSSARNVDCRLSRAHERDRVASLAHSGRETRERRRDAVDLRRVRLGHDAHVARHDDHCRGRCAQNPR